MWFSKAQQGKLYPDMTNDDSFITVQTTKSVLKSGNVALISSTARYVLYCTLGS